MSSETSLVAANVRLREWAEMVRECQNRPSGMNMETWCAGQGITKADYYYRLKRLRKVCLQAAVQHSQEFVDLTSLFHQDAGYSGSVPSAVIKTADGLTLEISDTASSSFLRSLIGALQHVE